MNQKEIIKTLWNTIYPKSDLTLLNSFLAELESFKKIQQDSQPFWYQDAVVYSIYVDLFNKDFEGLIEKLDYIRSLGVNTLWLLPILDSPMRDAGFDIRNYDKIRHELLGLPENHSKEEQEYLFGKFLNEAHTRGLRVIFDIALNHVSETHPWFQQARSSEDNPYRDYFIWTKDTSLYQDARIIFKGMETSNWEKVGDWYFFHRFFNFQPDLNYRNPHVLLDMLRHFIYWQRLGVDGFRADAIPYIWKEDGTDCENLPQTHLIVKFIRAILDSIRPGTLLLAEACQKPNKVVEYMGDGDECHAAYHFPLMPMFYKAIASEQAEPIIKILDTKITPPIPENAQWFTFLRCHDELSLELVYVSEEDRKYIHDRYCLQPEWDFRQGEGISARLANLFQFDERKIGLAYSMMLTLPGTPVIYYGDEFGKENDQRYYEEMIKLTGKDDTRFLVRGKINWPLREVQLNDPSTFQYRVFHRIQKMLEVRCQTGVFGRGSMEFISIQTGEAGANPALLAYERRIEDQRIIVLQNLSSKPQLAMLDNFAKEGVDLLQDKAVQLNEIVMKPFAYHWIKID
ncbi:MAG: alpha-amylase [Bacteroidales bacterium]|jgi:maltose alpha-D-glucosyltransferase/alpha-amylase|nr:alpha-amylase [Bacteroidales bacterium]